MKQLRSHILLLFLTLFLITGCRSDKNKGAEITEIPKTENKENNVEIITETMEFQAPDTISSGWNTWQYMNRSTQPHFILIDKHNDTITVKEFREQLLPPFGEGMVLLNEGKTDDAMKAFGKIPAWFADTWWPGGVGLISPGHTAETMLKLDPGYYIIECYVKMNNGMFHTNMGMYKALIVSEESSEMKEPVADSNIDISSKDGITFEPPLKAGTYTFAVNFIDQSTYENFQGHDINLVMIDDGADINTLEAWMNWMNPKGLIDPVPDGFTFLGGVNDMPAGYKGYFKATLKPGQYALISEVPEASKKNMLKLFKIED